MSAILRFTITCCLALATGGALAEDAYPNKPIRILVPYPPGGATDAIVRVVADKLSGELGQSVVVDNRPGASTIIATEAAIKAPADGYTLLVTTAAMTANSSLMKLSYDAENALTPVSMLALGPNILVIGPSVPASSIKELIAYAKANPGKINFGSAGNGTSTHIAGEMFKTLADIDIVHVPYKGDAPAITDLLGGRIQMMFVGGLGAVEQHVKTGKLKALAVSTPEASPLAPELPPVANDLPGFASAVWNGIMVPAGTPPAVIERLHSAIAKVLSQPDTRKKIMDIGYQPIGNSPSEFGEYVRSETRRVAKVVQAAHIHLQ